MGGGDRQGRLHVWVAGLQAEVAPGQAQGGAEGGAEAVLPLEGIGARLVPGDGDPPQAGVAQGAHLQAEAEDGGQQGELRAQPGRQTRDLQTARYPGEV